MVKGDLGTVVMVPEDELDRGTVGASKDAGLSDGSIVFSFYSFGLLVCLDFLSLSIQVNFLNSSFSSNFTTFGESHARCYGVGSCILFKCCILKEEGWEW